MAFMTYGETGRTPESYMIENKGKDLCKEYGYKELWDEIFNSDDSPIPKKLHPKHRIVVVDADAVVYRTAAACEKKFVLARVNGKETKFKNKTALKNYCKDEGLIYEDIKFKDMISLEPVERCLETLKKSVAKIYRQTKATHVIFLLGGSVNDRHKLKLPFRYKDNRKDVSKPRYLSVAKEFLNLNYHTFLVTGIEADDCVQGITEYIVNNTVAWGCAYQLDKDFHTSMKPNRYWHISKSELIELSGGLGSLYKSGSEVKGDGLMWVLFQLMLGDDSDGYTPKSLYRDEHQGKYAAMSFLKDFKDYTDEQELIVSWVDKWRELLPETIEYFDFKGEPQKHDWLSLAELYFQCLYMRISPEDDTTFESLMGRYGVTVDKESGDLITTDDWDSELYSAKPLKPIKPVVEESEFGFGW